MSDELVYYWKNGKLLCFKPKTVTQRLQKKFSQVHNKIGKLTQEEYLEYKEELEYAETLSTIATEYSERSGLYNALMLELTEEDNKHALITKYYGNYRYKVVNYRDYSYRIVEKEMIDSVYQIWYEDEKSNKD